MKAVTNSKKRPFTATNTKHETRLPQRKLPLGAIPNYMKNFKGIRRTNTIIDKKETIDKQTVDHFGMKPVCMKSHTKVKLKNISDGSFQDSITKINKFNLNYESLSNILVRDETNSKIQLVSVQSITIAVKDFLLESREVTNILSFYWFNKHNFLLRARAIK